MSQSKDKIIKPYIFKFKRNQYRAFISNHPLITNVRQFCFYTLCIDIGHCEITLDDGQPCLELDMKYDSDYNIPVDNINSISAEYDFRNAVIHRMFDNEVLNVSFYIRHKDYKIIE